MPSRSQALGEAFGHAVVDRGVAGVGDDGRLPGRRAPAGRLPRHGVAEPQDLAGGAARLPLVGVRQADEPLAQDRILPDREVGNQQRRPHDDGVQERPEVGEPEHRRNEHRPRHLAPVLRAPGRDHASGRDAEHHHLVAEPGRDVDRRIAPSRQLLRGHPAERVSGAVGVAVLGHAQRDDGVAAGVEHRREVDEGARAARDAVQQHDHPLGPRPVREELRVAERIQRLRRRRGVGLEARDRGGVARHRVGSRREPVDVERPQPCHGDQQQQRAGPEHQRDADRGQPRGRQHGRREDGDGDGGDQRRLLADRERGRRHLPSAAAWPAAAAARRAAPRCGRRRRGPRPRPRASPPRSRR